MDFLRARAYPMVRGVGDFYASYATIHDGTYNVLHSCAQVRKTQLGTCTECVAWSRRQRLYDTSKA